MNNLKRLSLILISFLLIASSTVYSQNNGSRKIAIIGGGTAGLSAAHYLLNNINGAQIVVFEKEPIVGGNAFTFDYHHSGVTVPLDMGAQYFTEGSWDQFISLLKSYNLFSKDLIKEFNASLTIANESKKRPDFISPKGILLRGAKISYLKQFYRFHKAAHHLYESNTSHNLTAETWVNQQNLTEDFKTKIAYPFLANSIGISVEKVKDLSAFELVKVFAFRGPTSKQPFYSLQQGLGKTLISLADSLKKKGVVFKLSTFVSSVTLEQQVFTVVSGDQKEEFDFVIFATHPDQAARLLLSDSDFLDLHSVLSQFSYTKMNSVLHTDDSYVDNKKPSFLTIQTKAESYDFKSSTQNLGLIDKKYHGIYKSWLSDEELNKLKQNGTLISSKEFNLPLVDIQFNESLNKLYQYSSNIPNLFFAGSWSEGVDNQENAVISGEKAAQKCRKFFERL